MLRMRVLTYTFIYSSSGSTYLIILSWKHPKPLSMFCVIPQLLGLAVKDPWLALGEQIPPLAEQILTLAAWTGLENTILTFYRGWFLAGKASWALIGHLPTKNVDYCMLVHSTIPCYQNLAHQLITFRTMCNISLREFHQLLGYF